MPILRDFSRSAKWDSVAKELSAGMRQNKKTDAEWCPPPITKQRPLWSLFCYVWRQDENPREWVRKSHAHFARLQSQCKMGQRSEGTERRNEAKQENRCRMVSSANNKTETLVVSVLLCLETGREPTGVGEKVPCPFCATSVAVQNGTAERRN